MSDLVSKVEEGFNKLVEVLREPQRKNPDNQSGNPEGNKREKEDKDNRSRSFSGNDCWRGYRLARWAGRRNIRRNNRCFNRKSNRI